MAKDPVWLTVTSLKVTWVTASKTSSPYRPPDSVKPAKKTDDAATSTTSAEVFKPKTVVAALPAADCSVRLLFIVMFSLY